MNTVTPAHVITSRLKPRAGGQSELIDLLRQYSMRIHAEAGCLHYSIHRHPGDDHGALTVLQVYATAEAFREHAAWMRSNLPELAALLAGAPGSPTLLEQVLLTGNPKEAFVEIE